MSSHRQPTSNLRHRQKDVLVEMIRSATPISGSGAPMISPTGTSSNDAANAVCWKVLIYDSFGRDIIAPLLKLKELRDLGVTLHMMIDRARQAVPTCPAIYFCQPNPSNLAIIAKDAAADLYQSIHINFLSQVSRGNLELLAELLAPLPSIGHIKVVDRTLSYVVLERDLFSLQQPNSYFTLNSRTVADSAMDTFLDGVVLGLSHVFLSTHTLPIIANLRTGIAEEVSRRFTATIQDLLKDHILTPNPTVARPLLLIVDRGYDIAGPLHHPFSYRCLLADTLGMRLNKVDIRNQQGKECSFEMDSDTDPFWAQYADKDFSAISGAVDAEIAEYKAEKAKLAPSETDANEDDASGVSRLLACAPQLVDRKRHIDAHTLLSYSLLNSIRSRDLDTYHGVEEAFLRRESVDLPMFQKLLAEKGTTADKRRLYLLSYLTSDGDESLSGEVEKALVTLNEQTPLSSLAYLKKVRAWSAPSSLAAAEQQGSSWRFAHSITSAAKSIVAKTLKGGTDTMLPLTRLVDAIMQEPSAAAKATRSQERSKLLDQLVGSDPRTKHQVDLANIKFSHIVVFVVGGGSYTEFQNLREWEQGTGGRKTMTYGATEIFSGEEFLSQLSQLGGES
jgi:HPt (histidine-containing phosphotransfer) domain-containing protein